MNIPNTSRMMALAITFALTSSVLATHVVTAQLSPVKLHRSEGKTITIDESDDDDGTSSYCGDYTVDEGEECDDGDDKNGKPWSECGEDCRYKTREVCGDGTSSGEEECDDGNGDNSDGCTNNCKKAKCGDGYIQPSHDEKCDAGWRNGKASSHCTNKCTIRPVCGNGTVEENEECRKKPVCGNGIVEGAEECDDGASFASGCNDECRYATEEELCGNGSLNNNEECDKGDNNGTADAECSKTCKNVERPNPTLPPTDDDDDNGTVTPPTDGGNTSAPSTDDDDGVAPQVRPAAPVNTDELEKNRIDELRRKRQEIEARVKAQKQLDREKAKEAKEANTEHEEEVTTEAPESELLCYDTAGVLTDDRQLCDADQGQFLNTESVDDETAQVALLKKFKGDNVAESHRADLIQTMQGARKRLNALLESDNHKDDVTKYLGESIAWLDRGITYFSEGPKSSEEVQQMVLPVKQLLVQAKALIQQEKALPTERVEIDPIVIKTERLLLKFRESFVALARGGVELDQDALTAYVDAAGQFVEIRSACAANAMECGRLHSVLELLKTVQGPIQEAFGENPEIYEAVQAKFEN
ncbi:MAG: DUF4215 domain-containing protein [bacterium]|nr:DUF4215 domain-containing protein [bacterium]MDA1292844.1 DUF4215 domain-containing protein [bacterium]